MNRRISPSSRAAFLAALLLLPLVGCSSPGSSGALVVPIDKFREEGGVVLNEQMRLRLKDILVKGESVKHLFPDDKYVKPNTPQYYLLAKRKINLLINTPEELEQLRLILSMKKTDLMTVVLRDEEAGLWRSLFSADERYGKEVNLQVVTTTCDKVTRIIYDRLNSIIKERVQKVGETEQRIDLDAVFKKLLAEEIEPYIEGLDEVERKDPCFDTFKLLKWLRGEDVPGFAFAEYRINHQLKDLLEPVSDALKEAGERWAKYHLDVKTIGYTDTKAVRGIDLQKEQTGIDAGAWGGVQNPLDVRYDACVMNSLDGTSPAYVAFDSGAGRQVGPHIENNCELGAARAYVATVYLTSKLGRDGVEYSYATGGVHSDSNKANVNDDSKKRRINIEFTIKAARAGQ